jgi:hypothetical protein
MKDSGLREKQNENDRAKTTERADFDPGPQPG